MTTQAQVIAVALDAALETGTFDPALQQLVADNLQHMRIALWWRLGSDGAWRRFPAEGGDPVCNAVLVGGIWHGSGVEGRWRIPYDSLEAAKADEDDKARKRGWSLCPQPKASP